MEVAVGERGQDVDPEDGDFLVSWLFFSGALFGSTGPIFFCYFSKDFRFFVRFGVLFLVPKMDPKMGFRFGLLIGFLL